MELLKNIDPMLVVAALCLVAAAALLWWIYKRHPDPPKSDSEFDDRQY